ncbi:hypothetical protein LWI29_032236 [Acer saccharum]|uniref:NPH3 domain-containing protein n=1 Tax=Acer saccharum TaxID=4024 RepID=A0AA39W7Z2_ACESA|nr:hypothetical protein LWI29_032236 [Acer saccharum]
MKFMKLGSKQDSFQTDDSNIRYVQSELASDITVAIGDVKFHLHKKIVEEFLTHQNVEIKAAEGDQEVLEIRRPGILSDASKLMVAKLIDRYLAEIAKDCNLPLSKFVVLAEMVSSISRPAHDGLYRAIDMYLKEHPAISKSERKKICKLMDCRKLLVDACMHAVQNKRLPLRVVVQVLFFEQVRAAASTGSSTPDLPKGIKDLKNGSCWSSRSIATNPEEDWDAVATAEELKALTRASFLKDGQWSRREREKW